MLPLTLLRTAQGHPILVELKSGETYNGVLVNVDHWMNLNLTKVTCTSREGDKFWKLSGIYIKGSTVKYMNIPENILELTPEEMPPTEKKSSGSRGGRGGQRGGRGHSDSKGSSRGASSDRGSHRGGRGQSSDRGSRGGASDRGSRGRGRGQAEYKPRGTAK